MTTSRRICHPFKPIFSSESRILILGSLPSVKSREDAFYYAHPRNRFWPMLSSIFQMPAETADDKTRIIVSNNLALWDVIESCTIRGSSDASIQDVRANDLEHLLSSTRIDTILCNGQAAGKWYRKLLEKKTGIPAVILPSTSPANASWSLDRLKAAWRPFLTLENHLQTVKERTESS